MAGRITVFLKPLLAIAMCVGALSACADPAPTYYQAFGFRCENKTSTVSAVLCNKSNDPGAAKVSRYCYKSLADTTCFDRPDPDQGRLAADHPALAHPVRQLFKRVALGFLVRVGLSLLTARPPTCSGQGLADGASCHRACIPHLCSAVARCACILIGHLTFLQSLGL